ncbi:MAG: Lrp/AsnC family transcriptional regulator [Candidatus Woesearchaeota archaeon]
MQIDEKDFKILAVLEREARAGLREIARKTRMPITTVHHRIKNLEEAGIIKGYSAVLDYEKLGFGVLAYVLVNIGSARESGHLIDQEKIAEKIRALENVSEVSIITGEKDMIIKVRTKNISQLNNFILKKLRSIEGVEKVVTMIALSSF